MGVHVTNPYSYQDHLYDKSRPENLAFLERFRRNCSMSFPAPRRSAKSGPTAIRQAPRPPTRNAAGGCTWPIRSSLLGDAFSAGHIRKVVEEFEAAIGDGWPSWALSNHDVTRVISRWRLEAHADRAAPLLMALLLSLRGTPCIYQGEELGLTEAEIPFEMLQDPFGRAFWPNYVGRDGCRTPMPWAADALHAGFTPGTPWLPVPLVARAARHLGSGSPARRRCSCETATFSDGAQDQPALQKGSIRFVDVPEPLLCFDRVSSGQTVRAMFNLGPSPMSLAMADLQAFEALEGHGFGGTHVGSTLQLEGFDAFFGSPQQAAVVK